MPSSVVDFISAALRGSIECSIADLRSLSEYEHLSALEVLRELEELCAKAKIDCFPALTTGELEDARVFSPQQTPNVFTVALERSLETGEGHQVEFKQTLGLNVRRLENDKNARPDELFQDEIIHEVIKTIIAFLNADGGVLVIGIGDDGTHCGIEAEFPYIGGNRNLDQWELRLNAALDAFIPDYRLILGYIRYGIVDDDGCKLCVVTVQPRLDRLCVCRKTNKDGADEIVYRRSGNQSLRLQARELEALILDRIRNARDER
jgi:hypothetical protein